MESSQDKSDALVPYEAEPNAEQKMLIEEMESVLYSISFGKQKTEKNKVKYQSFSAAISS